MLTMKEQRDLTISLIRRSVPAIERLAADIEAYEHADGEAEKIIGQLRWAKRSLESLYEIVGEFAPDTDYWKDAYRLDGTHAILTDEGWEPAELYANDPDVEILDEVNKPEAVQS